MTYIVREGKERGKGRYLQWWCFGFKGWRLKQCWGAGGGCPTRGGGDVTQIVASTLARA